MERTRGRAQRQAAPPVRAPGREEPPLVGAAVGVLSGGVALGIAQLAAGIVGGTSSPVIAVGSAAIDATPEWLKSFAIQTFGTHDKTALLVGIGVILCSAAIVLGIASIRRPRAGIGGLVVLGAVGVLAAITRPASGLSDAIPSVIGASAGVVAFLGLRRAADPTSRVTRRRSDRSGRGAPAETFDRRRLLWLGAAAAGIAAASGFVGQYLIRRAAAIASRSAVRIPAPADAAPAPPAGAGLRISGLSSFITPNDEFYRVDTALLVPAVDAGTWKLRVHGMVDRPLTIDYAQLLERPLIERDVTLTCVSNRVGGRYIGNARWTGARLKDLLDEAGVHPGANQIASRSVDGFTLGTASRVALDGRDSMLAVAMNGEPLPLEHGFPVRMVVPGLYGYESATKWITEIELTTFAAFTPYWVARGWAQQVLIKTESRIDTPKSGSTLPAGEVPIAGIAWAQHRGVEAVDVRIDDGSWMPASLAQQDTVDTWRQWVYRWNATKGPHALSVRATDDTGVLQTPKPTSPFPSGATGDHTIMVMVE